MDFNKLSATLRYVGLNLNPQVLELIMKIATLVKKGDVTLTDIDDVVAEMEEKSKALEAVSK